MGSRGMGLPGMGHGGRRGGGGHGGPKSGKAPRQQMKDVWPLLREMILPRRNIIALEIGRAHV